MKDGVVILNFARDLLVNDADMKAALAEGKVKRYVTDFPQSGCHGNGTCNCNASSGASTEESEDNCAVMAVKELMDYLENGNIPPFCQLSGLRYGSERKRSKNYNPAPQHPEYAGTVYSTSGRRGNEYFPDGK